jgi:hypothetical protein
MGCVVIESEVSKGATEDLRVTLFVCVDIRVVCEIVDEVVSGEISCFGEFTKHLLTEVFSVAFETPGVVCCFDDVHAPRGNSPVLVTVWFCLQVIIRAATGEPRCFGFTVEWKTGMVASNRVSRLGVVKDYF